MRRARSFTRRWLAVFGGGVLVLALHGPLFAQRPQATIGNSFNSGGNSFFENFGVNFGFNIPSGSGPNAVVGLNPQGGIAPGIVFQQGGAAAAVPPFGGFVPGNSATFGYTINSSLGNFNFGLTAGQGSSRSNVAQSPSITLTDGTTGFISDTSQRPFVTSVIPVVGGFAGAAQPIYGLPAPAPPVGSFGTSTLAEKLSRLNEAPGPRAGATDSSGGGGGADPVKQAWGGAIAPPDPVGAILGPAAHSGGSSAAQPANDPFSHALAAARQSSAGQATASVKEIQSQQTAADQAADEELHAILGRAQEAMSLGKPNVARIYYQQLVRRATGPLKQQALDALEAIKNEHVK